MNELKEMLRRLCSMSSVSGREFKSKDELFALASPYFDEVREDSFGNFIFVKKSKKANAPKMQLDAHLDEIGMLVSGAPSDGFLSIVPIGGFDVKVLPAAEVLVCCEEPICGVITSVPPHLSGSSESLPKFDELYIDVAGIPQKELEERVKKGTPVIFKPNFDELINNRVVSKSLDDKACVCALIDVAKNADSEKLEFDLYITVSAQEETGANGARLVAYDTVPDIAIITDVSFARGEGIDNADAIEIGKGAGISLSSLTNVALTRKIMKILDSKGIEYQRICDPSYTSTNNDLISSSRYGVRTALMSVALESMHTPSEVVSLEDIKSLSNILLELAYTPKEQLLQ